MSPKKNTRKKGSVEAPFEWNDKKATAALLIAMGQDTRTSIANQIGVHVKTVQYWESFTEFQQKIIENRSKVIQSTELNLLQSYSEQIFNMRHLINSKLNNKAEQKRVPVEKLLAEFRKYLGQIFVVQKGGNPVHMQSDVSITHSGSVELIEGLLKEVEGSDSKDGLNSRLLEIANEVVADKEKEYESVEGRDFHVPSSDS